MLLLIFWNEYVASVGGNNEHVIGGEWVITTIDVNLAQHDITTSNKYHNWRNIWGVQSRGAIRLKVLVHVNETLESLYKREIDGHTFDMVNARSNILVIEMFKCREFKKNYCKPISPLGLYSWDKTLKFAYMLQVKKDPTSQHDT